jgi:hypothetical protein
VLGRPCHHPDTWSFEKGSRNYVYRLSRRDIEKAALGLHLPMVAFAYRNDWYREGMEDVRADETSRLFRQAKRRIRRADIATALGLRQPSYMIAVIFRAPVQDELAADLRAGGFEVTGLPGPDAGQSAPRPS